MGLERGKDGRLRAQDAALVASRGDDLELLKLVASLVVLVSGRKKVTGESQAQSEG